MWIVLAREEGILCFLFVILCITCYLSLFCLLHLLLHFELLYIYMVEDVLILRLMLIRMLKGRLFFYFTFIDNSNFVNVIHSNNNNNSNIIAITLLLQLSLSLISIAIITMLTKYSGQIHIFGFDFLFEFIFPFHHSNNYS